MVNTYKQSKEQRDEFSKYAIKLNGLGMNKQKDYCTEVEEGILSVYEYENDILTVQTAREMIRKSYKTGYINGYNQGLHGKQPAIKEALLPPNHETT